MKAARECSSRLGSYAEVQHGACVPEVGGTALPAYSFNVVLGQPASAMLIHETEVEHPPPRFDHGRPEKGRFFEMRSLGVSRSILIGTTLS
jgi:hypothetical protein